MENGSEGVALFNRQQFGDVNVDKLMDLCEIFFVNEGVIKTTFEILEVKKHSFDRVEMGERKAEEIVSEEVVIIEAVVLLFSLCEFDHF